MSTPSTETPKEPIPTCCLCEKNLEHTDIIMVGLNTKAETIQIHPKCLGTEKDSVIQGLANVGVYTEPGKTLSTVQQLVVKKRIKAVFKAMAIAQEMNRRQQQATTQ